MQDTRREDGQNHPRGRNQLRLKDRHRHRGRRIKATNTGTGANRTLAAVMAGLGRRIGHCAPIRRHQDNALARANLQKPKARADRGAPDLGRGRRPDVIGVKQHLNAHRKQRKDMDPKRTPQAREPHPHNGAGQIAIWRCFRHVCRRGFVSHRPSDRTDSQRNQAFVTLCERDIFVDAHAKSNFGWTPLHAKTLSRLNPKGANTKNFQHPLRARAKLD